MEGTSCKVFISAVLQTPCLADSPVNTFAFGLGKESLKAKFVHGLIWGRLIEDCRENILHLSSPYLTVYK